MIPNNSSHSLINLPVMTPLNTSLAPPRPDQPVPVHRINGMDSRTLFAGAKEVLILHHGEPYRLRETRQGKLILTK
jgi:hemin uptake protein HemP